MLVAAIAAVKLILHLYAGRYYGYFVDELYNLALARHLAWGYVDVAPMIALIGRIELTLFGDSLSAIRLASAIAGAGLVLLDRSDRARTGRRPLRPGARRALRPSRSRHPGAGSLPQRQRLRAAVLDGLRAPPHPHHQYGQRKTLALVRIDRRSGSGNQALHADLRLRV